MKLKSRPIHCCIALSAAVVVGLAYSAHAQTPPRAKPSIPPALIKECTDRIAKDFPKFQIVGNFFPAKKSRGIIESVIDPREEILIVAPTKNPTVFGTTNRGFAGCAYAARDGRLEFKKLLGPGNLPQRYRLMPGEV